jgi:hypothetical protein
MMVPFFEQEDVVVRQQADGPDGLGVRLWHGEWAYVFLLFISYFNRMRVAWRFVAIHG